MQPSLRIELSPPSGPTIDLLAAGDFCLTRGIAERNGAVSVQHVFHPSLLELLRAKHLSILNLEFPLAIFQRSDRQGRPASGRF